MDEEISDLIEKLRETNLQLLSSEEWQKVFDFLNENITHSDSYVKKVAIKRATTALWAEAMQEYRVPGFQSVGAYSRLLPIFKAIESTGDDFDFCLQEFVSARSMLTLDNHRKIIAQWLQSIIKDDQFSDAAKEIARAALISYRDQSSNLQDEANSLGLLLDDPDPKARAAAAKELGELYETGDSELPPLDVMIDLIKNKEIERPGIAGAFWSAVQFDWDQLQETFGVEIDIIDWMLDILTYRKGEEPDLYGYNSIDFYAHELMAGDPVVIEKLLDIGQHYIAVNAATEIENKIDDIKPVLMKLGDHADEYICRLATWHLAYYYGIAHPKGKERGYVKLISRFPEMDIFVLFRSTESNVPYAAVLYPRRETLSKRSVCKFISCLLPKNLRLKVNNRFHPFEKSSKPYFSNFASMSCEEIHDFSRAFVNFRTNPESQRLENVIISWRSDETWHPDLLLEKYHS